MASGQKLMTFPAGSDVDSSKLKAAVLGVQFRDRAFIVLGQQVRHHMKENWSSQGWRVRDLDNTRDCGNLRCMGQCADNLTVRIEGCLPICSRGVNSHGGTGNLCWRRAFRQHLQQARSRGGFLLQLWDTKAVVGEPHRAAGQEFEAALSEQFGCRRLVLPVPTNELEASRLDLLMAHACGRDPVAPLLQELQPSAGADAKRQSSAALDLVALCAGSDEILEKLGSLDGLVQGLVSLLEFGSAGAKAHSSAALAKLCGRQANKGRIGSLRGVLPLLVALLDAGGQGERQRAGEAIGALCKEHKGNQDRVSDMERALPAMVTLLEEGDASGMCSAANGLVSICSGHARNQGLVGADERAIPALILLLETGDVAGRTQAALALGTLSANHRKNMERITVALHGISALIALLRTGSPKAKTCAASALGNLCQGPHKDNQDRVGSTEGLAPALADLLEHGDDIGKMSAAHAVNLLTKDHPANKRRLMADPRITAALEDLAEGGDVYTRKQANAALQSMGIS